MTKTGISSVSSGTWAGWCTPTISMARARHTLATGELLTKSAAVEQVSAPDWLIGQLRARRSGADLGSPRVRTALIAWRDVRRTVLAHKVSS